MHKITKRERLDILMDGWYRLGWASPETLVKMFDEETEIWDTINEVARQIIASDMKKINLMRTRSEDFIGSDDCYYPYKGKTYVNGKVMVHVYSDHEGNETGASIVLLAR